jgi:gas vesicle structural protein
MLHRETKGANLVDLLDRVMDKGIVVDAWVALSMAALKSGTHDARIVVASVETYLRGAEPEALALGRLRSEPAES